MKILEELEQIQQKIKQLKAELQDFEVLMEAFHDKARSIELLVKEIKDKHGREV